MVQDEIESNGTTSGTWRHFGSAFLSDQCAISNPLDGTAGIVRYAKGDRPENMSSALVKMSSYILPKTDIHNRGSR